MKRIVDVQIGQVKAGRGKLILQSKAIGSCIVIIAYDATENIGSLAHVMLPGRAPAKKKDEKTKYAANAIDTLVRKMDRLGSKKDNIEVVLVGGGNILNREDDTICQANIESATHILKEKNIPVRAQAVGGIVRRNVSLDVERGIVSYTEGNGGETELWRA